MKTLAALSIGFIVLGISSTTAFAECLHIAQIADKNALEATRECDNRLKNLCETEYQARLKKGEKVAKEFNCDIKKATNLNPFSTIYELDLSKTKCCFNPTE